MKTIKIKNKNKPNLKGIIKITAKPMGFVMIDGIRSDKDIIIFEENLNCALDKDEVEVEIVGKDFSRGMVRNKGRVVKILKRNKLDFVGTIEKSGNSFVFVPDDFKFYKKVDLRVIPKEIETGTKALVSIKSWTNPNLNPLGEIIKIIGRKGEHETEMQSILLDKGIVYDFPVEVENEAEEVAREFSRLGSFSSESPRVSSLRSSRLSSWNFSVGLRADFRDILTFTIDPIDAKDFDDALSYEEINENTLRIGVHIADVSHFVRPGTALDKEARKRSFSTYLVDRTIPMLPEVLSNDLCSLNPKVDRFAFSVVFDIEKETGKVLDRWFGKTIINSNKRFSYEEAQNLLDSFRGGDKNYLPSLVHEGEGSRDDSFVPSSTIFELNRLANIYRAENKKNGAIEFETDEVKFQLDENGKPLKIYKKARLDTMKMIEEWMLLANREVAKFLSDKIKKRGGASIFRIHNLPKMERIEELAVFVRALGHELPIRNGTVSAKDINLLLKQIEGHASESLIKTAVVRSMAKAVYSTKNIGHFGLAFEYYTHFTSPIRRYPDLLIHRILDNHLNNKPIPKNEFASFEKIALEASEKEIVVAEAERESIKYKQVEFMQDKIGLQFEGVISGVNEWGIYVEDLNTKAEGIVRFKEMKEDNFVLDEKNYCVVSERTKKKYQLGDIIKVELVSADLDRKILDLKLI